MLLSLVLLPFRLVFGLLWLGWQLVKFVLFAVALLVLAPVAAVTIVASLLLLAIFL